MIASLLLAGNKPNQPLARHPPLSATLKRWQQSLAAHLANSLFANLEYLCGLLWRTYWGIALNQIVVSGIMQQ
jgi:hypothetical protein